MIGTPAANDRVKAVVLAAFLALLLGPARPAAGAAGAEFSAVIHVHSTVSSGRHSLEELVAMARSLGIDVLVPTDHDRVAMEYGLPPLRNLLKIRRENPSVLRGGADGYLREIARLNGVQDAVRLIPGVQSSPFYHWSGSPFRGDLTAHDYQKELLLIGMPDPGDYARLPVLHNGLSLTPQSARLPGFGAAIAGSLAAWLLFRRARGRLRMAAAALALAGLFAAADRHPFSLSRFDPYHGDAGIAPYQDVIDHVRARGGLVFWAHPESNHPVAGVSIGPVTLVTGHYAEDLARARGYTGFAALYGDNQTITAPGGIWDRLLIAYARGDRPEPAWAIAEADFHDASDGLALDAYQTIVRSPSKEAADVLAALQAGRCYAVRKGFGYRLVLSVFEVRDPLTGRRAGADGGLAAASAPRVRVALSASDGRARPAAVRLVRGGVVLRDFAGELPLELDFRDDAPWTGRSYYRLEASAAEGGGLISNPVFVERAPPLPEAS
jgi:hypothetical protein